MAEDQDQFARLPPSGFINSPDYWASKQWRICPEIDESRQAFLANCLSIQADITLCRYPFRGVKLQRQDIEWLLATYLDGYSDRVGEESRPEVPSGYLAELDLRGAELSREDLSRLPLARLRGGLTIYQWSAATEEQRSAAIMHLEDTNLQGTLLAGAVLQDALMTGANLQDAVLEEAMLRGASLRGARLQRANLNDVDLNGADLENGRLQGSSMEGASLRHAMLARANLAEVQLSGADLEEAQLQQANLRRVDLRKAFLDRAQLQGAHLDSANLQDAYLRSAHLEGADLRSADLSNANLRAAHLNRANMYDTKLVGADLRDVNLEGANLQHANLQQANLEASRLAQASLQEAELQGAKLRGAYLVGAELGGADLQDADLHHAIMTHAKLRQTDLGNACLVSADLQGANLQRARLAGANIGRAKLGGADLREAHLEGSDQGGGYYQHASRTSTVSPKRLPAADLRRAVFDKDTDLNGATLGDRFGYVSIADLDWGNANLAVVKWMPEGTNSVGTLASQKGHSRTAILGDEVIARSLIHRDSEKSRAVRLDAYESAVRANRQLATALRMQGLNEAADEFAYRAQDLQRRVQWQQRQLGRWLFSIFLAALSGYGYRLRRILVSYGLILLAFAGIYFVLGLPHAQQASVPQELGDALLTSFTAIHGRVFLEQLGTYSVQAWVAAIESVVGIVIEGVFVAMLVQRFFAR